MQLYKIAKTWDIIHSIPERDLTDFRKKFIGQHTANAYP